MAWPRAMGPISLSQILNITQVLYCFLTYPVEACHVSTRHFPPPQVHRGGIKGGSFLLFLNLKPSFLHARDLTRPGPRARRAYLLTYLLTYLRTYLLSCLLTYLLIHLLTDLLTCLLTYLLTH